MGSIPTHSRQFLLGLLAFASVVATTPVSSAAQDRERWEGPGPLGRAVRSAVFPAWGQLTNGKTTKATLLFSLEAYLYTRILLETRRGKEDERTRAALQQAGAPEGDILLAEVNSKNHFDNRRNLLFWVIIAGFYGAIDAYVDANLGDFDKDLEEGRTLFGGVSIEDRSVELGLRF